ncbi:MAG: hypothetical protein E5X48_23520 [Mesorhizobium sp.]|uniref:DUF5801 repeats-in-toxin domain-containing protein n=1 Tax=Mesorhizobium sp. TaxID=1871066 RepID=UPI0011F7D2C3|nr:DUF5801 repeats-in-toxin domain-containing protein [Mesorhizobium sp.]TIQ33457.1 MAG: hypothetical protein E5X48_23520 [Mesorhizobium sp.]
MALTINVFGSTKIDETTGLQDGDIALADVPSNVSTAFSNAGADLANAIQVAGGGGDDLSVTPDSGFAVNGLGFVDPSGGALDGDASGLFTLEGRQIFLYADPNNDNVVLGREGTIVGGVDVADPSGAIVFAVYVEETTTNSLITGGKFWTALFEPLKHTDNNDPDFTVDLDNKLKVAATQSTTFSFDNAPSGANEFMMFGNNPAGVSTSGIVVTGRAPDPNTEDNDHTGDTVSSSQAGPHATVGVNGQHVGPGNGLSFTFVDNPAEDFTVAPQQDPHPPQGLDSTEADHESNIQFSGYTSGVTAASFTVAQVNPTGNTVTVKITAFKDSDGVAETGTGFVEGFADDVTVNITEVKINGVVVAANLSGDTAVISGVKNGDVVSYTTTSAHTRVLIENVQPTKGPGSNITLDIGGFTILSSTGASEFAGTQLQFDDDGPSITAVASTASVRHDETAGVQSDTDVDGTAFAFGSTTIASLFTNVPSPGDDPDVAGTGAIGFARSTASLLTVTGSAGADGPAAQELSYALGVTDGTDSGVETTAGTKIFMYNGTGSAAGLILGRVGTENAGGDTADPAGTVAFALATNATTGEVFLAQYLSLKHPTGGASYDETITLASGAVQMSVTRTDGDGDTATDSGNDIGLLVKFDDDGPTVTVDNIANGTYAAGGSSTWSDAPGADGFKSLNVTFNNYTIDAHSTVTVDTSLGTLTTTDANGNYVFNGTITDDFTNDGIVNPQPVAFTLTFDAVDPGSGTYDIQLTTPPGTITTISTANGSLGAGGPDPVQTLTIGNRAIVFSAVKATAATGPIEANLDKTEAQIQTNPLPSYIDPAAMNVSTSGIGVANNNFEGNALGGVDGQTTKGGDYDESFVVDPTAFLVSSMKVFIDNSVGGYDPSTEGIFYRTYTRNADNSITVGAITKVESADLHQEAGGQVSFVIPSIDQKNDLDAVQLFMGSGTVKIPVIEFNISNTFNPEALDMNFTATIADGDNDTKSDPFAIHVAIA